jgi:hypothetical protein
MNTTEDKTLVKPGATVPTATTETPKVADKPAVSTAPKQAVDPAKKSTPKPEQVKPKSAVKKQLSVEEKVLKEYNEGKNYAQLAIDHRLSVDEVESIIGAIAHEQFETETL